MGGLNATFPGTGSRATSNPDLLHPGTPLGSSQHRNPFAIPGIGAGVGVPPGGAVVAGGGGGGRGGGSTVGAGTGGYQTNTAVNPYFTQLMNMYTGLYGQAQQLYNKPLDFAAERAASRAEQSQRLNEIQQMRAAGGRGGLYGSELQGIAGENARSITGAEAGFGNRQLQAQRDILGQMGQILAGGTGLGSAMTAEQQAQLNAALGAQSLNLQAVNAEREYQLRAAAEARAAQTANIGNMVTIAQLAGLA